MLMDKPYAASILYYQAQPQECQETLVHRVAFGFWLVGLLILQADQ